MNNTTSSDNQKQESRDFIRGIIDTELAEGKNNGKVATRFPPEPNGFLHIGHAKSICLNFGIANEYEGTCNLRFDDTNPVKEDTRYVDSIREDVRWLGFDWGGREYYASDYFEKLYGFAVQLIMDGKAYVDDLSAEEIREHRGTLTQPGRESPFRNRSPEENLDLFIRMKNGDFEDGSRVLRAKIDMASPNISLRDPTIYRIRKASHHRTGETWCIYPMYDFTHCISDALEGITHSICTLEFENNRPLYDWFLDQLPVPCHPRQIEFARLNLSYTVLSKRRLLELVSNNYVSGWDDPRMPTIAGFRRRGYTPSAIRDFADRIGIAKRDSVVDLALLEFCLREELNRTSKRIMGVIDPVKLVIDNYPAGGIEEMDAINNPEDESMGSRKVPFSGVLYIERDDFREDPPKKFYRLYPGNEVRLRYAYYVTCTGFTKGEATGLVNEIHCTYDPETRGGSSTDGRKVKSTIHWVSADSAVDAEVRLYDNLFLDPDPGAAEDYLTLLNPESLKVMKSCKLEPFVRECAPTERLQFERLGYFIEDSADSDAGNPVFNRIVTLKDTWAKIVKTSM